jgi:Arc/MetJ-type ribon-helix-helix transcriptional regulator
VNTGDFQTASEILRERLRLLEERDLLKRISASSMGELEERLMAGVASLNRGEGVESEEAFKRLCKRARDRKERG